MIYAFKANPIGKIPPSIFSVIKKIYSAIEHRQELSRTAFEFEFQDVPYSLSSDPISMYNGTKCDIMIQLPNAPASHHHNTKCKSVTILEMSPIIRAKCLTLPDNISCFNDLAVVLYDEVLSHVSMIWLLFYKTRYYLMFQ